MRKLCREPRSLAGQYSNAYSGRICGCESSSCTFLPLVPTAKTRSVSTGCLVRSNLEGEAMSSFQSWEITTPAPVASVASVVGTRCKLVAGHEKIVGYRIQEWSRRLFPTLTEVHRWSDRKKRGWVLTLRGQRFETLPAILETDLGSVLMCYSVTAAPKPTVTFFAGPEYSNTPRTTAAPNLGSKSPGRFWRSSEGARPKLDGGIVPVRTSTSCVSSTTPAV